MSSAYAGLAHNLEQSKGQRLVKTAQLYDAKLTARVNAPIRFAAVQAAASSNKPQLAQASTYQKTVCLPICCRIGMDSMRSCPVLPDTLLGDLSVQAELQNLSQQLNQQIQEYTKQGFQIKDISSGMTPGSGEMRPPPTTSTTCFSCL